MTLVNKGILRHLFLIMYKNGIKFIKESGYFGWEAWKERLEFYTKL